MESITQSAAWSGDSRFSLIMNLYETYVSDGANNYSDIAWNVQLKSTSPYRTYSLDNKNPLYVYVNGEVTVNQNISYDLTNNTVTVANGTMRIYHDADGGKQIPFAASFTDKANNKGSASLSGAFTLTKIARSFTQTPVVTFRNDASTTAATFDWRTSETCNAVKYSLNGGAEVYGWLGSATSGAFTISNLSANTSYTLRINAQRQDSGMWSYSNQITFKTSAKTVRVRINGAWKDATPYVRVNGQWKVATPYTRVSGQWKKGK